MCNFKLHTLFIYETKRVVQAIGIPEPLDSIAYCQPMSAYILIEDDKAIWKFYFRFASPFTDPNRIHYYTGHVNLISEYSIRGNDLYIDI